MLFLPQQLPQFMVPPVGTRVPFSPHPRQHLLSLVFWIMCAKYLNNVILCNSHNNPRGRDYYLLALQIMKFSLAEVKTCAQDHLARKWSSLNPASTTPNVYANFLSAMRTFLQFFFFFFVLKGPLLRHMEVPSLGVELELQLSASTTATAMLDPSRIFDLCLNAGSLTR